MRKTLNEPPTIRGRSPGPEEKLSKEGLWVRFFGDFEVFYRGEVVELGRNSKAVAIFRRLLAHYPQPVSQATITEWLWPESDPQKARWSLNSATYTLRGVLGVLPEDLSGCVVLDGGRYRISSGLRVSSDVREFDVRYEQGRLLERAGQIEEAIREYEEAVGFYRNDYLVEDLYEDWTMIERERLISAYVDMLDRLSDHYTQVEQLQKVINSRYQLLEKDRYHEESYRSLMRCYARLGLWGRALHQYQLCEQALESLYGTCPATETRDLYKELLGGNEG